MSKELPYFKFHPSEWITGNITLCSMEAQGLFINLCAYYWIKDCSISLANAKQRFSNSDHLFDELINNEIVLLNEMKMIRIDFLNEQMDKFTTIVAKRTQSGKRGGLAKAKQMLSKSKANANILREDKEKDKDINIPFDEFWNLYLRKQGSKSRCEVKWNNLTDDERQKIITSLPAFFRSIRDAQFIPYPETYLNQKRWEDELTISVPSGGPVLAV